MQNSSSLISILKYEWRQFCLNTTLHGWKFTVLPKKTKIDRWIWYITCIASIITSVTLLLQAWIKFQKNPTILVTDSTQYPIYHYPFPAITICNFNRISKENAFKFAKKLKKPENISTEYLAEELKLLYYLTNIVDNKYDLKERYAVLQDILNDNKKSVERAVEELTPSCESSFRRCHWKGDERRCDSLFETIKTSDGFCCSFNYYALKNHNFSGTFVNKAPKTPRRLSACGYQTGLEVLIQNRPDDYFATTIPSVGFKILIHNAYEYPDLGVQSVLTEIDTNYLIGINPELAVASQGIKKIPVSQRNCLLSQERQLMNFAGYNFHNCIIECRINLTMEYCNCVPFFLYNKQGTMKLPKVCTLDDLTCLNQHEGLVESSIPGYYFNDSIDEADSTSPKTKCDCLPDCEGSYYTAEYSMGVLDGSYTIDQFSIYGETTLVNQTLIRVFFNDLVGTKHRRDVVFTWHTLLAYYGGILGLFIGFSFVSLVEIIYFFTLRLMVDWKTNKSGEQSHYPIQEQIINLKHIQVYPRFQKMTNLNTERVNQKVDAKTIAAEAPCNVEILNKKLVL